MSDRPKITIKKKGDVQPPVQKPHVEPPTPPVQQPKAENEPPPVERKREIGKYLKARQEAQNQEIKPVEQQDIIPESTQKSSQAQNVQENSYDDFKPFPWLKTILISVGALALVAVVFFFVIPLFGNNGGEEGQSKNGTESSEQVSDKNGYYIKEMLPANSEKIEDILSDNTTFRQLMTKLGVPNSDVNALEDEGNKYSIRRLRSGDKYTVAHTNGNPSELLMLMIEPKTEPYTFYKVDLEESLTIEKMDKQVEIRENYIAAIVEGTLGQTFIDNNLNLKLIASIEDVLAWTVDLFDVGDGDRFKVLYDEEFVNGRSNRIDKIKALYFEKDGKPFFAFNNNEENGFFNEFGYSMKKSFLATPIKYGGVITSGFGLRVHPITGHTKEHLGTDFAAPEGTPIQAVADGTITIAQFKANNGNYVKMRHDKIYETQYLHMKEFAPGIRPGVRVKQGDIIGLVGSTGLSSGPHVCFRFWKNKKQVNPTSENSGSGTRIPAKSMEKYYESIEPIQEKLKNINYF